MNRDNLGLICTSNDQHSHDGGDTCANTGRYYAAFAIKYQLGIIGGSVSLLGKKAEFLDAISKLQVAPGVFVRNPRRDVWFWNDPEQLSRDQLKPLVLALGLWKQHATLEQILDRQISRGIFFSQNNDLFSPFTILRAMNRAIYYPIYVLQDLSLFLSVLSVSGYLPRYKHDAKGLSKIQFKVDPDFVDHDINLIVELCAYELLCPSPVLKAVRWLYSRIRPDSLGKTLGHASPTSQSFQWYYRRESGNNPEIADEYEPIFKALF